MERFPSHRGPPEYTALQLEGSSTPTKRLPDRHNRCWHGKYWCVKVRKIRLRNNSFFQNNALRSFPGCVRNVLCCINMGSHPIR